MVWESKKHVVPRLDYFENQGVMTGSKEFPRVDHMIDEFRYKLETAGESIRIRSCKSVSLRYLFIRCIIIRTQQPDHYIGNERDTFL